MHSKDSVTIGLFDQWQKGIEAIWCYCNYWCNWL